MKYRTSTIFLAAGFSTLFLLLLLLGQTFLSIYILIFFILFVFFVRQNLELSNTNKIVILFWSIFLIGLFTSALTSHSIPLTLDNLVFFCFSYLLFCCFLSFNNFKLKKIITIVFIEVSLVVTVLSYGVQIWGDEGIKLPGMNLIYPTYGHNHLSALLILTLPLVWFISLQKINEPKHFFKLKFLNVFLTIQLDRLWLIFPLFYSLTLLITFSRISIFLGLIQFICVVVAHLSHAQNQEIKQNVGKHKKIILFTVIGLFFFLVLFLKSLFSLVNFCPLPSLERQLCKSLKGEPRPFYWEQSFKSFKQYPWLGYGPGTFQLISTKYKQLPDFTSSYAHNIFLQELSEVGILGGGAFFLLITILFIKSFNSIKSDKGLTLNKSLYLGVLFSLFNSFFDFDWSFIGVFSLCLVALACIISSKKMTKKNYAAYIVKFQVSAVALFIVTIGIVSFVCELFVRNGQVVACFNLLPFSYTHKTFFQKASLSQSDYTLFEKMYVWDSNFLIEELKKNESKISTEEKINKLDHIDVINPWYKVYNPHLVFFRDNPSLGSKRIKDSLNLIRVAKEKYGYDYYWQFGLNIRNDVFFLINSALDNDDVFLASELYRAIIEINPYLLSESFPDQFYQSDATTSYQKRLVLSQFYQLNRDYFGKLREQYANEYLKLAIDDVYNLDRESFVKDTHRTQTLVDWYRIKIHEEILPLILEKATLNIKDGKIAESKILLDMGYDFYHNQKEFEELTDRRFVQDFETLYKTLTMSPHLSKQETEDVASKLQFLIK